MFGWVRRVGPWVAVVIGLFADIVTLATGGAGGLIVASVVTYLSFVWDMPLPLRLAFFVGVFLLVFVTIGLLVRKMFAAGVGSSSPQAGHPSEGTTGVRTRGGSFRSTGQMRIRKQDRSIDSEDTDW